MRSTPLLGSLLPAAIVAAAWLRLEEPRRDGEAAFIVALALAPALVRPIWGRVVAVLVGLLVAIWVAFAAPPWDLMFMRGLWWERVGGGLDTGLQDFGDVLVPFNSVERWEVHGLVLLAIFLLALGISMCAAAGRPLAGVAVVLVGAGVPVTLAEERTGIVFGALVLAACLWLVAVSRATWARSAFGNAALAAVVIVFAAVVAGAGVSPGTAAVDWKDWKLYDRARGQVGVGYVWDANYDGIRFPQTRTTVLRVRGPSRANYWRASTLDAFQADHWREYLYAVAVRAPSGRLPVDALVPPAAFDPRRWVRQQVEIVSLRSNRLPAASTPVALASSSFRQVTYFGGGILGYADGLQPGQRYTMWSYTPRPGPTQLAASRAEYPETVSRYLNLGGANLPAFGTSIHDGLVEELLSAPYHQDIARYRQVWEQARAVTGGARTPYAATLALERWFRSGGGFTYDEEPPRTAGLPPLADFVLRTKQGYCQHFAGAMALMLRFLGVPARVAVGFTGGSSRDGVWTVTDHDAHAWVEVWFDGWGWLPFDPTPGRGALSQTYTVASDSADAAFRLGGRPFIPQDPAPGPPEDPSVAAAQENDARGAWVAAVLAGTLLALVAGLGLVKVVRRQHRYRSDDPRRLASAARADLADRLRDQGLSLPAQASLGEVTGALQTLGFTGSRFATAAARARYGPPGDAPAAAGDTRRELRSLVRALRSSLPARRRLRGYLSLRSLRVP